MKAIIDDKLYDTDKAEKVFSYRRKVDKGPVFWDEKLRWAPFHAFDIYKTTKGAYFEHDTEDNKIYIITKAQAQEVVRNLDPDRYMELFEIVVDEA